jgi:hypothetical protein
MDGKAATRRKKRRGRGLRKKRDRLLRRSQASQYLWEKYGLRYALQTLAKYACQGMGPEFQYVEKVPYYTTTNLDRWVLDRLSRPRVRTWQRSQLQRILGAPAGDLFSATAEPAPQHSTSEAEAGSVMTDAETGSVMAPAPGSAGFGATQQERG